MSDPVLTVKTPSDTRASLARAGGALQRAADNLALAEKAEARGDLVLALEEVEAAASELRLAKLGGPAAEEVEKRARSLQLLIDREARPPIRLEGADREETWGRYFAPSGRCHAHGYITGGGGLCPSCVSYAHRAAWRAGAWHQFEQEDPERAFRITWAETLERVFTGARVAAVHRNPLTGATTLSLSIEISERRVDATFNKLQAVRAVCEELGVPLQVLDQVDPLNRTETQ